MGAGCWLRRPDQPSITKNLPMHGSPSLVDVVVSVSSSVTSEEDEPLLPNAMGVAGMPGRVRTYDSTRNVSSRSPKPTLT